MKKFLIASVVAIVVGVVCHGVLALLGIENPIRFLIAQVPITATFLGVLFS